MKLRLLNDKSDLEKFSRLLQDGDPAKIVGKYLFGKFQLQVSEYKLSSSERVSRLYHRRRLRGLCVMCGEKIADVNSRTGKPYRLCPKHRKEIDGKVKRKKGKK